MTRLVRVLLAVILSLGLVGFFGQAEAQALDLSRVTLPSSSVLATVERRNPADALLETEFGQKLDLNNAPVRAFRVYRGFYPNLAKKIIDNAPYEKVEDVLNISGLSEHQKSLLEANLGNFTVTQPVDIFNQEANRINPGDY
jgi:photosystem II PsbU protein